MVLGRGSAIVLLLEDMVDKVGCKWTDGWSMSCDGKKSKNLMSGA